MEGEILAHLLGVVETDCDVEDDTLGHVLLD
jgi:hypothetical protein